MTNINPLHLAAAKCARLIYESEKPARNLAWKLESAAVRGVYWERGLEVASASFAVFTATSGQRGVEDAS